MRSRSQVVFGVGDPDKCKLVIIGEAPGAREDEQGEPFVGKSGQLLNEFLSWIGLTREEVFITNTILCRPQDNRNPSRTELQQCKGRLDETLRILKPKVIITLGNFATQYMLNTKVGITKIRGHVFHEKDMTIIPMQHPAVLLYNGNSPEKRAEFQEDFENVKKVMEEKEKKR